MKRVIKIIFLSVIIVISALSCSCESKSEKAERLLRQQQREAEEKEYVSLKTQFSEALISYNYSQARNCLSKIKLLKGYSDSSLQEELYSQELSYLFADKYGDDDFSIRLVLLLKEIKNNLNSKYKEYLDDTFDFAMTLNDQKLVRELMSNFFYGQELSQTQIKYLIDKNPDLLVEYIASQKKYEGTKPQKGIQDSGVGDCINGHKVSEYYTHCEIYKKYAESVLAQNAKIDKIINLAISQGNYKCATKLLNCFTDNVVVIQSGREYKGEYIGGLKCYIDFLPNDKDAAEQRIKFARENSSELTN